MSSTKGAEPAPHPRHQHVAASPVEPEVARRKKASSARHSLDRGRIAALAMTLLLHAMVLGVVLLPGSPPAHTDAPVRDSADAALQVVWLRRASTSPLPVPPIPSPPTRAKRAAPIEPASPLRVEAARDDGPRAIRVAIPSEPVQLAPSKVDVLLTREAPAEHISRELPATTPAPVSAARAKREQDEYLRRLMAWLVRHRSYPDDAKRRKEQGVVHVKFTIDREGQVLAARVEKSPGIAALDQAALQVLQHASPVPPMPASMRMSKLTITLPIEYSLVTH